LNADDRPHLDGVHSEWAESRFSDLKDYAHASKHMNRPRHRFFIRRVLWLRNKCKAEKLERAGPLKAQNCFQQLKANAAAMRDKRSADAELDEFVKLVNSQAMISVDLSQGGAHVNSQVASSALRSTSESSSSFLREAKTRARLTIRTELANAKFA